MTNNPYIYIFIMAAVTFSIRALPMTLIRIPIQIQIVQSFLYYVPYVTLSVMTFPAILTAPRNEIAGLVALLVGVITAWKGFSLLKVAICCCLTVFVLETILVLG